MLPVLLWYLLFCFLFCYDYQTGMRTEGSSDNNCHSNDLINGTVLGKAVPGGWRQALLRGQEGLTPGGWCVGVTPHPGNLGWFCGSGTCRGGAAPTRTSVMLIAMPRSTYSKTQLPFPVKPDLKEILHLAIPGIARNSSDGKLETWLSQSPCVSSQHRSIRHLTQMTFSPLYQECSGIPPAQEDSL